MKNILLLITSDADEGFIILSVIVVVLVVLGIWATIYTSIEKSDLMRKLENGDVEWVDYRVAVNNDYDYEARRIKEFLDARDDKQQQEDAKEKSKNTRWENSDYNVKQVINKLETQTHKCNKCFSNYMRIWNLNSTLIELRCENCKKKFTYLNDSIKGVDLITLVDDIELLYDRYNAQQENEYFRSIDFIFDLEGQKSNSPNTYPITLRPTLEPMKGRAKGKFSMPGKTDARSRRISQEVKDKVWNRDGGKCVECGSNENLEFDHIIPFSKGGANTYRNLQLLCEHCNRSKSNTIG